MSQTSNILGLFQAGQNEGTISPASAAALNVIDIGQNIQIAMGTPVDQVNASSVILVAVLVDDSGSIRMAGNSDLVRQGVNSIKSALLDTKQTDGILMCIRYLNGDIICPFVPLKQVPDLTTSNYNPNGGTPLYDQSLFTLATVIAKAQEFSDNGVPVRSVTAIVSDGADMHSTAATAAKCESVISDMLMSENHIVAAMGIDDRGPNPSASSRAGTDFRGIFQAMGIQPNWILTPASDPHSIRSAFATLSQSAVRASQAATFSQTAMGGFGNP